MECRNFDCSIGRPWCWIGDKCMPDCEMISKLHLVSLIECVVPPVAVNMHQPSSTGPCGCCLKSYCGFPLLNLYFARGRVKQFIPIVWVGLLWPCINTFETDRHVTQPKGSPRWANMSWVRADTHLKVEVNQAINLAWSFWQRWIVQSNSVLFVTVDDNLTTYPAVKPKVVKSWSNCSVKIWIVPSVGCGVG